MSVRQISRVLRHSRSKGSARLVLIALADVANDDGEITAYARSHSILAAKANVDSKTVTRAIDQLVTLGEVEVLRVGKGRASSDYHLHVGPLREDTTPTQTEQDAPTERGQDAPSIIPSEIRPGPSSSVADGDGPPRLELTHPPTAEDFDQFWTVYPRHVAKAAARKAWARAVKRADVETILAGAGRYAAEVTGRDLQHVAHPTTWLNADRWDDEAGANRGSRGGATQQVDQDRTPGVRRLRP